MGQIGTKSYMKGDYEGFHALKAAKKQSQFKAKFERSKIDFTYNIEDCRGPLGLAMTSISLLLCALVALWL